MELKDIKEKQKHFNEKINQSNKKDEYDKFKEFETKKVSSYGSDAGVNLVFNKSINQEMPKPELDKSEKKLNYFRLHDDASHNDKNNHCEQFEQELEEEIQFMQNYENFDQEINSDDEIDPHYIIGLGQDLNGDQHTFEVEDVLCCPDHVNYRNEMMRQQYEQIIQCNRLELYLKESLITQKILMTRTMKTLKKTNDECVKQVIDTAKSKKWKKK
jgi:hypothetical protein